MKFYSLNKKQDQLFIHLLRRSPIGNSPISKALKNSNIGITVASDFFSDTSSPAFFKVIPFRRFYTQHDPAVIIGHMEHQDLVDYIEAAYKLKQYLSAFLMQAAYIESVVKINLDFVVSDNIEKQDTNFYKALRKKLDKFGIMDSLKFLKDTDALSEEHYKILDEYRIKRNKIVHDLIFQMMNNPSFEKELKETYNKAHTSIISSEWFKEVVEIVEIVEKKNNKKS